MSPKMAAYMCIYAAAGLLRFQHEVLLILCRSEEECKTFREQFKKLLIIIPCLEDDLKLIGSSVRAISGLIKLVSPCFSCGC